MPIDRRNEETLAQFSRQAGPSQAVLKSLRPPAVMPAAPAWPPALRESGSALEKLIRNGSWRIHDADIHWTTRLRLRRLLFTAVLIAPTDQGGLALNRDQVCAFVPDRLQTLRSRIGSTGDPASCPACALWSWLEVLGTNNAWSHASVRALAHRRDDSPDEHRHLLVDTNPDWHYCTGMLPAIDRWGYVDPYVSMHRSSLSVLINAMATMIATPVVRSRPCEPPPRQPARHITSEEEQEILTRADEINARIATILDQYE